MARKRIVIATPEKLEKINPKNKELWRKYLVGKNMKLSDTTKYNYESDMNQFFIYILDNYENQYIFDIEPDDMAEIIEDYVAFCSNMLGNKTKRIARRLSTISSMYLYYKKKRKIKENPLDYIERPTVDHSVYEVKQTYLSQEQVDFIRKELDKSGNIQLSLFFEFGISTMARVNAISNVKFSQIDMDNRVVERVKEKEGYDVTLFFNNRCKKLIEKWIRVRQEVGIVSEYLFVTKYKHVWSKADKATMQSNWIKKIGKIINEPELHCHDLRHSGSNLLFQAGMPIETVSELLNHKTLDVTKQHYLTININKIKSEKDRYEV